jgi:hypothetical protein
VLPVGRCPLLFTFCVQDVHLLTCQFRVHFKFLFAAEGITAALVLILVPSRVTRSSVVSLSLKHAEYWYEHIIQSGLVF